MMQAGVTYSGIVLDGPGAGQTWTSASPTFDVAAAAADFRADPVGFLAGRLGTALKAARDAG